MSSGLAQPEQHYAVISKSDQAVLFYKRHAAKLAQKKRRKEKTLDAKPYFRPQAVPRHIPRDPAYLQSHGVAWESWMAKDTPKIRRIVSLSVAGMLTLASRLAHS